MLKRIYVTNHLGERVECKIDGVEAENESGLIITSIDGLGPVKATINMTEIPSSDGSIYNSSRLSNRNIVLKAVFTHASSIEEARHLSYKYFPINKKITLQIETDTRTVQTEGYVESNEPDIFSKQSSFQVSIVCESAYFSEGGNDVQALPVNISYIGDINTGVKLEFSIPSDDVMESLSVSKIDVLRNGQESMKLDMSKMSGMVPNTMPDNWNVNLCSLMYTDNDGYKFFMKMPTWKPSQTWMTNVNGRSFVYNDELYIIGFDGGECLYKYDEQNHQWIVSEIGLPMDGQGRKYLFYEGDAFVYNGEIHLMGCGSSSTIYGRYFTNQRGHWKYNGTEWVELNDLPGSYSGKKAIIHNSRVYAFFKPSSSSYSTMFRWNETSDTWESVLALPTGYNTNPLTYINALSYENYIYIFGGMDTDASYCYKWAEGNRSWTLVTDSRLQPTYGGAAVVYNGKMHCFGSAKAGYEKYHALSTGVGTWDVRGSEIPYEFASIPTGGDAVVFHNRVYIFGSKWANGEYRYTADSDNTHLKEDDKLIINTVKGQKKISLIRNGNEYNVLNVLERGSTWLELSKGTNQLAYHAEGDSSNRLVGTIEASETLYEGV